jgi:hypothetical protein
VPEERLAMVSAPSEPDEVSTAEMPRLQSARGDGRVIDAPEVPEPRSPDGAPRHRAD